MLSKQLLKQGHGASAADVYEIVKDLVPQDSEVENQRLLLEDYAQAAYLKGYSLFRDGGPNALKGARRLWQFAASTAGLDSPIRSRAQTMLLQTATKDKAQK